MSAAARRFPCCEDAQIVTIMGGHEVTCRAVSSFSDLFSALTNAQEFRNQMGGLNGIPLTTELGTWTRCATNKSSAN